jgi:hypothetical protein
MVVTVIARSPTRLRLLRKLRRAWSPPKRGARRRKGDEAIQGSVHQPLDCFASLAMTTQYSGLPPSSLMSFQRVSISWTTFAGIAI